MRRTYSELRSLRAFMERYHYLRLGAGVGEPTFGHERFLNQAFYRSREWRNARDHVITRDMGNDLGLPGYGIGGPILVHHINPLTPDEVASGDYCLVDPENLISVSHATHNAIHYGDPVLMEITHTERKPGDTILW